MFRERAFRVDDAVGKTGTLADRNPFRDYSWFVGFAPVDKPEVVVSVLIGNSDAWHLRGHEVAKRLIDHALAPGPATAREKDRSAALPRSETLARRDR